MHDFKGVVYYQTSTWPSHDDLARNEATLVPAFARYLYHEGVFAEIDRLLKSNEFPNGSYVGHMTLIAICCAIDSAAAFADGAKRGAHGVQRRFELFVESYFPSAYATQKKAMYELLRCDGVHEWYLQRATITSVANDPKHLTGSIHISLPDFFDDVKIAFCAYASALDNEPELRAKFLGRYESVR